MKKVYIRPEAECFALMTEGMIASSGEIKFDNESDHNVTSTEGVWSHKQEYPVGPASIWD